MTTQETSAGPPRRKGDTCAQNCSTYAEAISCLRAAIALFSVQSVHGQYNRPSGAGSVRAVKREGRETDFAGLSPLGQVCVRAKRGVTRLSVLGPSCLPEEMRALKRSRSTNLGAVEAAGGAKSAVSARTSPSKKQQ